MKIINTLLLNILLIVAFFHRTQCGDASDSSGQNFKWVCDCVTDSISERYCQEWTCEIERISAKCFPGSSLVLLPNFETKAVGQLQIGDKILTMNKDNLELFEDEVVAFLHYSPKKNISQDLKSNNYLQIITEQGNILRVSKDHLLFIQEKNSSQITTILAKNVKVNDTIYGLWNGNNEFGCQQIIQEILNFEQKIEELGEFAPLTSSGTLIVDGIFVSSYANLNNQNVADIVFAPYKIFQQCLPMSWKKWLTCYTKEGINCYAYVLMKISECKDSDVSTISTDKTFCQHWECDQKATSTSCFPSTAFIIGKNGTLQTMSEISYGDKVMTVNIESGEMVEDQVIGFLHKIQNGKQEFLRIELDGEMIEISRKHLILARKEKQINSDYIFADKLQIGDEVFVNSKDWQPIINISEFNSTGIYAPLTTTGTLLVNNILVSCYANLENQLASQIAFLPYRYLQNLLSIFLNYENQQLVAEYSVNNIHWYANLLMMISRTMPEILNYMAQSNKQEIKINE